MKIAHFNTVDYIGGAAKVAYRLHSELNNTQQKVDSTYYVKVKKLQDETVKAPRFQADRFIERKVADLYINNHRTDVANTLFTFTYNSEKELVADALRDNDIFHLHWVENFLNLEDVYSLQSSGKPVIYTLHDERPYTGGCHCTFDCKGFMATCSECEQLEQRSHALPKAVLMDRVKALRNSNIKIIAPSTWIKNQAEKSSIFHDASIDVVPHGVDTGIYKYSHKGAAKERIGVAPDVITLMFNAHNCNATHKGYKYFVEALAECSKNKEFESFCKSEKIKLIVVGDNVPDLQINIPAIMCGYVTKEQDVASLYQATDVLINPTLAESFSLVSLEAMACGAVVVGFKTGGMTDYITQDNGRLVEQRNSKALAEAIVDLILNRKQMDILRDNCVSTVLASFDIKDQVRRYMQIYDNSIVHKERMRNTFRPNQVVEEEIIGAIKIKKHQRLEKLYQVIKGVIKKVPMSGLAIFYIKKFRKGLGDIQQIK